MDQLTKHTVDNLNPREEVQLDEQGFAADLGSPYTRISDFHIGLLADSLHCSSGPRSASGAPNPHRVREVREILAALAGIDDETVDLYAPELFDSLPLIRGEDLVTRGRLEYTILRLLVANHELFATFLGLLSPRDKIHDPFRKLKQRAQRVFNELTAYSASPSAASGDGDGPRDVAWAARHLEAVVQQIRLLVGGEGDDPGEPWERASAARVLVWIFKTLVREHNRDAHAGTTQDDRNLYQRLVGNALAGGDDGDDDDGDDSGRSSGAFMLDALFVLRDQTQFVEELQLVRHHIELNGYREPYMRRLDDLLTHLRRRKPFKPARAATGSKGATGSGSKRQVSGGSSSQDRRAKRAK